MTMLPVDETLLRAEPLPHCVTLPVLGIATHFETNSSDVRDIIEESFGRWRALHSADLANADLSEAIVKKAKFWGATARRAKAPAGKGLYLALSTKLSPEVVGYPDTGKTGVGVLAPDGSRQRFLVEDRLRDTKGYWDGEDGAAIRAARKPD